MTSDPVRGVGKARAGASDTTMLIWKVIAASPGITRQEIWERVEHSIPEGYALRRRGRDSREGVAQRLVSDPASRLSLARSYVLTKALAGMRYCGSITSDGSGHDHRYTVAREPGYRGNADAIDVTGTKAADHMAVAAALRIAEKALAKPYSKGGGAIRSQELYEAVTVMVKALRAKGSTDL